MGKLKIVNNLGKWIEGSHKAMDRSLNRMAIDIERLSKTQVPHDKGQLKASGSHERLGFLKYRVKYNKEYAAYQEYGGDGKGKVIRRHSKPGKKTFYLKDPGELITSRAIDYIKKEAMNIRI